VIRRSTSRWIPIVVLFAFAALGLAACGGGGASKEEIAQAEKHGRQDRAEKEKERKLESEIQQLKKERQAEKKRKREKERKRNTSQPDHGATAAAPAPPQSSAPEGTDCGEGVVAGPETSCGFALETRNEYEAYIGSGPGTVEAYSEANETWYAMSCSGAPHACSGAISATVYFP
jgi:hypothetical protein